MLTNQYVQTYRGTACIIDEPNVIFYYKKHFIEIDFVYFNWPKSYMADNKLLDSLMKNYSRLIYFSYYCRVQQMLFFLPSQS